MPISGATARRTNRFIPTGGVTRQIAWADPQSGVSFAYLTNTIVFPPGGTYHPRARELSQLAGATRAS